MINPPKFWPLFWLALFALSQVLVPALLLLGPRPVRFGWQMYSAAYASPTITLLLRTGAERPLPLGAYIVRARSDIRIDDAAVVALCRVYPEAAGIRYQQLDLPEREVVCPA